MADCANPPPPNSFIYTNLSDHTSLKQFLWDFWEAVFWAIVVSEMLNKLVAFIVCVCVFSVNMNWVWSDARSSQTCKFGFSYRPFRALDMLMFMIILHERMNIKHFQNVFDHKVFFLVKLILRLQFKETILGEQNVLSRNLLGVLSSLPLSCCLSLCVLPSLRLSFLLPFFSSSFSFSYHFLFAHLIDSLPLPLFLPFFCEFSNLQIPL